MRSTRLTLLFLTPALLVGCGGSPTGSTGDDAATGGMPDANIVETDGPITGTSDGTVIGNADAEHGMPDAATGTIDAATGMPDAATSTTDAATGMSDAATSTTDAATGMPDAATSSPDAATGMPDAALGPSPLAGLMPRAVVSHSTAIIANPVVVPIRYSDDPNQAAIDAYYAALGASQAWTDQVSEYGVGAMTEGTPRELGTMPSKTTEVALLDTLTQNLTNGSWGSPNQNTVYAFHIPSGVKFEDDACCNQYDGYHYDTIVDGVDVAYSINCECPTAATTLGITLFQDMGVTMGHQALEAATDPRPSADAAWAQTDDAHAAWTYATGGELADLCQHADSQIWLNAAGTNATQRSWSNAAAAAGHDPCVGNPTVPYYQTIPTDPDSASVSFGTPDAAGNSSWAAKGFKIAVGATGTLTFKVLSDVPTAGPFNITVKDLNSAFFGGQPLLTAGTITGPFHSGDTVTVSMTVDHVDPDMSGGETYVVETSPASGSGPTTYWFGLIVQ